MGCCTCYSTTSSRGVRDGLCCGSCAAPPLPARATEPTGEATTIASYPSDLRYSEDHVWARPEGKLVVIGITEAAVANLGTVGFVELPYPGELYKSGEVIGRVSGGILSAPIKMPFTGQINSVNRSLDDGAAQISDDSYGAGWIVRIEPGDPAAPEQLMDAPAYEAFLSSAEG